MENSTLVDSINEAEPSNMTALQLKTLEQQLSKDLVVGLLIIAHTLN